MIILHGDNQVASRQQLTTAKQEATKAGKQLVELGSEITVEQVVSGVEMNSLFGSSNLVVIENLFSGRPSNDRKTVVEYLLSKPSDVVIWEGKDVSAKIRDFDPQLVRRFDLPKYVWKFLDDLEVNSLQLALTTAAPEQILALLTGHLRKLIMVSQGVLNLPAWQMGKLKSQLARFNLDQLVDMDKQLLDIDYAQKTSAAPYDLATALEIFVVRLK